MADFCTNYANPITRGNCSFLVREKNLTKAKFDTGLWKANLKGRKPKKIPPKSDGSVSELEISKQLIIEAEKEYVKWVAAIRSGKELPPTPAIDHIRKNGDEIPWLFKDRKKLEVAMRKTKKLWEGWSGKKIGNLGLFKGLYRLVTKSDNGGYGQTYNGYKPHINNIDETVSQKHFQCVEGFITVHGHELLVAGLLSGISNTPKLEIYQTTKYSSSDHLVMGFHVMHGKQGRNYIIDSDNDKNPVHIAKNDELKKKIRIEKTHVIGLYYLEQAENCFNQDGTDRKCVEQNIERISRYAGKSFFTVAYGVAHLKDMIGDCAGAKKDVEDVLRIFPRLHTASIAKKILSRKCVK